MTRIIILLLILNIKLKKSQIFLSLYHIKIRIKKNILYSNFNVMN